MHDLYGVQIEISSYNDKTGEYTIRYTYYDIFGLDKEDIEKDGLLSRKVPFGKIRGFAEWYVLQHCNDFSDYKPFLTYMKFEEKRKLR